MAEFNIGDYLNIIAQILGFISMGLGILVYQFNKHSSIMMIKVICSVIWCVHYALLGLWAGVAINILNVVRDYIYGLREKKNINTPFIPAFFCVASVVSVLFTWENWWSIVPMVASICSTLAHWQTNTVKLKLGAISSNGLWLVYDIFNGSVSGSVNDAFVLGSIIISLIRIRLSKRNRNQTDIL